MESVKHSIVNFCKGFGIWLLLLLFNTRSGETCVNSFKIVLDITLAVILVDSYRIGKNIALLIAVLTIVVTIMPLSVGLEILLLIGIVILGGILLKTVPEDIFRSLPEDAEDHDDGTIRHVPSSWKSRNFFNPFEKYSYSPDTGVSICKGIIRRSYSTIPTTTTRVRIYQNVWQRFLGFCDVSFQNNYTGGQFGEDGLKNIRIRSAIELMHMIP